MNKLKKLICGILALSVISGSAIGAFAESAKTVLFSLDFTKVADGTYTVDTLKNADGVNLTGATLTQGTHASTYNVSNGVGTLTGQTTSGNLQQNFTFNTAITTGCIEFDVAFNYTGTKLISNRSTQILTLNSQTASFNAITLTPASSNTIPGPIVVGEGHYDTHTRWQFADGSEFYQEDETYNLRAVIMRNSDQEDWTYNLYDMDKTSATPILTTTLAAEDYTSIVSAGCNTYIGSSAGTDVEIAFTKYSASLVPYPDTSSGREECRSKAISVNKKLGILSSVTIVDAAPFDIGSIEVTYSNCTSDGAVRVNVGSTMKSSCTFNKGSGTVECISQESSGISKGSKVVLATYYVSATIDSVVLHKENSPGIDWYAVDVPASGISLGTSNTSVEMSFPFNVIAIEFSYNNSGSSANTLYVDANGKSGSVSLPKGTGNARVNLSGAVSPSDVSLMLRMGSSGTVSITGIKLHKESKVWPERINQDIVYSGYEAALQTASVFKTGSNIFKSKNAIRYLSYENTDTAAFIQSDKLYAPIKAIALALDLYIEDKGTSYLLRSADNAVELTIQKSSCVQNIAGDYCYSIEAVANNFNYTAIKSDDGNYLIIDKYKVRANEIKANHIASLISEFGSYEAEEVSGKTWYVNANVPATGDGSEASPFKTIQEAADRATAGDRVIIKGGTYRETVTPKNSGTAKNPIIFEAASGEQVTVSALNEIKNFRLYYDGVYVAMLPKELDFGSDFVTYGGNVLVEGRQPNTNTSGLIYPSNVTSPLWPTKGNIKTHKVDFMAQSATDLQNGSQNALRGATYVAFKDAAWANAFGKVLYSSKDSAAVTDVIDMKQFGLAGAGDWGYLTNSRKTLDMPGEWYAVDRALYIIPPTGVAPEDLKVEAKQRYVTFNLSENSCIQIKNINTTGGSVLMGGELNVLYGGTHKFTSHFTYPLDGNGEAYTSANAPITAGKSGNYVAGKNNSVLNAIFDTGAGSGIILGGRYGYVSGNTILDTGYGGQRGLPAILIRGSETVNYSNGGHDILFNTVCKTGRMALGINSSNVDNNPDENAERVPFIASEIAYNDFSYGNILARDSGIIYLWGANMGNDLVKTEIHHNVLSNSVFTGENNRTNMITLGGAYADNYTGNGVFHHNIAYYEGNFTYDENTWSNENLVGNELYLQNGIIIQDFSVWRRKYSVVEAHDNMGDGTNGTLNHPNGFDKTVSGNYPDGKIFKYGA